MNSRDNKSSGELKREVLHELNNVNNDLDRIQGRMTPGQFIDDALFTPVGRNPRAIYDHLIANPIGTAFLSLGTLLLMEDDSHVTYETQMRTRTSGVYHRSIDQVDAVKAKVSGVNQKLHGAIDRTKEKIDQSKDKITGLKNKVTGKLDSFQNGNNTGEADLYQGGELGANSIDTLKDNIGEDFDQVKQTVSTKMDTVKNLDPMTFAAIGAGLGALTGIALPVSEKEQTLIDQKLGGKMSVISSEFQDALNQSVKMLKDELLGKFTDFDVNLFRKNETYRSDSQI